MTQQLSLPLQPEMPFTVEVFLPDWSIVYEKPAIAFLPVAVRV